MSDFLGKTIRTMAKYPGSLLVKTGISPNQLTVLGFLVNCVVAYFIALGRLNYLIVGILIWAAGFFDALDGSVARARGQVTVFGDFLDSVIDRYSDFIIYIGIFVHFLNIGSVNYAVVTIIAMMGSMAVSYVRAKAESIGAKCEVGLMPRTSRVLLLGAGFIICKPFWAIFIIAILSHITVVQRILYVRKNVSSCKS